MLTRRTLLGSAAALLAGRFLVPTARAEDAPQRLLIFFSPNGTVHEHWRPEQQTALSFRSGTILEPLAGWEDQLLVMDGLDFNEADNHEGGMRAMLTGNQDTSIDQVIAAAIGGDSRFRSLELGVQTSAWGGTQQTRMCYSGGSYVTPDDSPTNVWKRLFGDLGDEDLLARRASVLDLANEELNALHAQLGSAQREQLDVHLDSLRDVEKSLSGGGDCDSVARPDLDHALSNDLFPESTTAQLDLAAQALACGTTRVATVQLSHTIGPTVFTWLGETDGHHSLSHAGDTDTAGVASFVNCERWFAEQFAYLLGRLEALGILDSTLVVWAKEMGDGRMHVCTDVPWVIAGGGSAVSKGRYLSLGSQDHRALLSAICETMGVTSPFSTAALELT